MKRYLFTGGGTLGSLSPLLAVAERVAERSPGALCTFVTGPDELECALVTTAGFSTVTLRTGKLRRYVSWRTIVDIGWTAAAFFRSLSIVRRYGPDAVMTAGSFVSVPVVWAARCLGVPVLVHQQDLRPGLANKLMVPFAASLSVAFTETARRISRRRAVRVTGNPVRRRLFRGKSDTARSRYGFSREKPMLLVLGGSTGARALNELLVAAKERIVLFANILHVVGQRGTAVVAPGYVAVPFLGEEFADALALASVVVTRAGLATLSELAALRKPTIVVPIPDSHQEENADYFRSHHAALVLHQNATTAASFTKAVHDLLGDESARRRLAEAIGTLNPPQADDALATELLQLAAHHA